MKIQLWCYEITDAIISYLNKKYGIDTECIIEEMNIESDDDLMARFNLYEFKQDQEWNNDKSEFIIHNKYELDGIYLKRKKKGGKNYQYVKLDNDYCKEASMNAESGTMTIWIHNEEY